MSDRSHRFAIRVYYEDTDAGGIVYHSNYLKFAERARTEWLRTLGIEHRRWREETGLGFVVRRCEIDYRRPAWLDDMLVVTTSILEIAGASMLIEQVVRRDDEDVARLELTLALTDREGRPARLPQDLRAAIAAAAPQGVND